MKKIIKIVISLALVFFIFRFVESGKVAETLKLMSFGELALVVFIYFLTQVLSSYKWYLINQELSFLTNFPRTVSAYFTGMFVNSYGLGVVGGDLTRALLIAPESQKIKSLAGVFIDRLHGMLVLGLIGSFSYIFWNHHFSLTIQYTILPFLIAFPLISIIWFFFPRLILFFIPKKFNLNTKLSQVISYFDFRKKHLLTVSLLSGVMHLSQIFLLHIIAIFLGAEITFHYLLVIIPFVNIITSLPFSWNGLGVREAVFIFFLSDFITKEQAVSIGIIWLVTVTLNSLIGGLITLLSPQRKQTS